MQALFVLLPVIPLVSAFLIAVRAGMPHRQVARISVGFATLTLIITAVVFARYVALPAPALLSMAPAWGSLYLDPLSAVMMLAVAGISLVVHVYSVRYMAEEPGYARFFTILDMLTAVILLMIAAGDLITLLVAWHLIGVLLYFLLGQDLNRPAVPRYAFWTLFTYRIGDLPLIFAAMLLYQAYGTFSLPLLFEHIATTPDTTTIFGLPLAATVALLVALAAFARSAQFPLHTWLPYSMEGPTPVSALMHAGIVNAGGFIVNRFVPVFVHASDVLHLMFAVGLITAILGSMLMLTQNDVKKALGYSTMGQMGFMFVECGVGAFSLAIYHLIAHALFKGTLFLGAGNIIGNARRHDGVPHDEAYTFVVERKPVLTRLPWILAAAITVVVPAVVLGLSDLLFAGHFVAEQGAIILLFFGWVTGAQLIFATYRMRTENPWRLMGFIIVSLIIVVAGYTLIEHSFDRFLYPDRELSERVYAAASIPLATFELLIGILTVALVLGWLATYYHRATDKDSGRKPSAVRLALYSLISRELYIMDLYASLTGMVLGLSRRLNVWMRWK